MKKDYTFAKYPITSIDNKKILYTKKIVKINALNKLKKNKIFHFP